MKRADLLASLDIGSAIKRLREEKGLSQEDLAKDICDRTNITKLENGHSKIPSLSFVLLLCDRLEVTIEEFLNYAMSNSYNINHKLVLIYLIERNTDKLDKYLKSVNYNLLSDKDKNYYQYLQLKINLEKGIFLNLKEKLLILSESRNKLIKHLAVYELIKYKLITDKNIIDKFFNSTTFSYFVNKKSELEYFYIINDSLLDSLNSNPDKSLYILNKQIEFINSHECYNYLIYFYKNKGLVYKDDPSILNDIKHKIISIKQSNIL